MTFKKNEGIPLLGLDCVIGITLQTLLVELLKHEEEHSVSRLHRPTGGLRSLTGVCPDVSLQQPGSGESFPAYFANTRQSVSPDVHFESSQAHVFLLAVLAAEGLPRLGVAVQLLVFEQSRVRGVRLGTQTTLELLRLRSVRVRQLGQHPLVLVAPRTLGAAVVLGGGVGERRRVARDGGEVAGERGQRQAAGSPHGDGAVRRRAQDLRLRDDGQRKALVEMRRDEH